MDILTRSEAKVWGVPIMTEYQIQPNTRRCAITGRELRPGERYFTALSETAGQFVRQDYSAEAWTGPPAGVFSFWSGRVPDENDVARPRFDDDLLLECFERLEGQSEPRPGELSLRRGFAADAPQAA